jgi:uncharacterized protein
MSNNQQAAAMRANSASSRPGGNNVKDHVLQVDVPIPMRDGTVLRADIYRPAAPGQYPVLLQRTAYGKNGQTTGPMLSQLRALAEGYAVIVQDSRGRYASDGDFRPFDVEIEDGYDSVEWCAAQDWANGRVGMFGTSYVGATQWLAAIAAPPSLRAIFPVQTAAKYHDGWVYQGGALSLAFTSAWTAQFLAIPQLKRLGVSEDEFRAEEARLMHAIEQLRRALSHRPLTELPMLSREGLAPYFYDWLQRPDYDEGWQRIDIHANHNKVTVPAFNLGSWYDLFIEGPPVHFSGMRTNGATQAARQGQRLLMGPWTHNSPSVATAGQRYFGWDATLVLEDLQIRWFNRWLKDIDDGLMNEPPVRLYVMNDGWRDEHEWPLARTEYTRYYLHSGGRANSASGDGRLSKDPPGQESPDRYLHNPANPVPTMGAGGIADQRPAESRTDMLVYTTPPLTEAVEVTGPVEMVLHASSSAVDTDFVARLVDVSPDGYATNVCDGILRARYRKTHSSPELLEPNKAYEFRINMLVTSNLFRKGHSIRLEIASSCYPKFDVNPGVECNPAEATETVPAVQTVFHEDALASYVLLPVIPR